MKEEISLKAYTSRGFDLIIANLQEGLHVLSNSSPSNSIHAWNDHERKTSYNIVLKKDWWDFNEWSLHSSLDTCLTLQTKLYIVLLLQFLPLHCVAMLNWVLPFQL